MDGGSGRAKPAERCDGSPPPRPSPPRKMCSADLVDNHNREELPAGFEFGEEGRRYDICTLLGQGAFARVYKCEVSESSDGHEGEAYAVKVVSLTKMRFLPDFEKQQEMLSREVDILRTLRHERIVNMHDFFATEDHWYLVMELVLHGELFHLIKPSVGMREFEAKYIFHQLLEGIGYINSKGVIHRDMKPENVLIVRFARDAEVDPEAPCKLYDVKIADFGLSKVREGDFSMTQSRVGTPVYAAPEIFSGKYDEKVDAWSLGAILYVMLCGQYPFDGRSIPREMVVGMLTEIRAQASPAGVCTVEFACRDGSMRSYGKGGTESRGPWTLQSTECVIAALQEGEVGPDSIAASLTLITNSSRMFEMDTPKGGKYKRFVAPQKSQIVGLELVDGELVSLRTAASKATGPGAVASISGCVGSQVDRIEFHLRDGSAEAHGGKGGEPSGSLILEEEERILAAIQEPSGKYLGYAWYFVTSKGRVLDVKGTGCRKVNRAVVPLTGQLGRLCFGPDGRLDGSDPAAKETMRCANFKMDFARWDALSADSKQMIYGLLRVSTAARLTLEECWKKPWLLDRRLPNPCETFQEFITRGSQQSAVERAFFDAQELSDSEATPFDPNTRSECSMSTSTVGGQDLQGKMEEEFVAEPAAVNFSPTDRLADPPRPDAFGMGGGPPNPPTSPQADGPPPPTMSITGPPTSSITGPPTSSTNSAPGRRGRMQSKETFEATGAVAMIRGRVGTAVDRVELQLRTGQSLSYGGHGGGPVGPWKLGRDEYIIAVEQEYRAADFGYLGNETAFFTSRGNVITITGTLARRAHRFAAPSGMQIVKLCFNGPALSGIETAPADDRIAQVTCRLADAIDRVQLIFRDGSIHSYGGTGGVEQRPFSLHAGEYIVAVAQEHAGEFLGFSFAFFTSTGGVIGFDGRQSVRKARFGAGVGEQIWGMRFEGSRLAKVIVRPVVPRCRVDTGNNGTIF